VLNLVFIAMWRLQGDRQHYASEPQTVVQAYLRRPPPAHERSLQERCLHADAAMAPWQQLQAKAQDILSEPDDEEKFAKVRCSRAVVLCVLRFAVVRFAGVLWTVT
jgi:hypothetical protein